MRRRRRGSRSANGMRFLVSKNRTRNLTANHAATAGGDGAGDDLAVDALAVHAGEVVELVEAGERG